MSLGSWFALRNCIFLWLNCEFWLMFRDMKQKKKKVDYVEWEKRKVKMKNVKK